MTEAMVDTVVTVSERVVINNLYELIFSIACLVFIYFFIRMMVKESA